LPWQQLEAQTGILPRSFHKRPAVRARGALTVRRWNNAPQFEILTTPRIGIRHCADWPLRFLIAGNRSVSGPRRRP
jgi:3-methyladenine DNA glycosylase Mpg